MRENLNISRIGFMYVFLMLLSSCSVHKPVIKYEMLFIPVQKITEISSKSFGAYLFSLDEIDTLRFEDSSVSVNEVWGATPVPGFEYSIEDSLVRPNPFSPRTSLRFRLINQDKVTLSCGRIDDGVIGKMDTLFCNTLEASRYYLQFNEVKDGSGLYLWEMSSSTDSSAWKMIFFK